MCYCRVQLEEAHRTPPPLSQEHAGKLTQDGSGSGSEDAGIKPTPTRPSLTSRATALCTKGADNLKRSLCATLLCSILILIAIIILRELGWLALHYVPKDTDNTDDYDDLE